LQFYFLDQSLVGIKGKFLYGLFNDDGGVIRLCLLVPDDGHDTMKRRLV
jgi:hypothetical protein